MNTRFSKWLPVAAMLSAALLGCAGAPGPAEGLHGNPASIPDGTWEGALDVSGTKLKLILHSDQGKVKLDVPQQNAYGIEASSVESEGGGQDARIVIRFRSIGAAFSSLLQGEELVGQWEQGAAKLPLTLRRTTAGAAVPAASAAPGLEVAFPGGAEGVTLAGTLVLPEGKGPFPAAILLSGSGPQDRDETVFGKKPFAVLARVLASRGIATLRFDDRGVGASKGDFTSATSADFARDAEAALRFLRTDARIRADGIGYVGHSEGGLVALIAAVTPSQPQKPAFVACLSGPMAKGIDILLSQSAAILRASGADEKAVETAAAINRKVYRLILDSPTYPKAEISSALEAAGLRKEDAEAQQAALGSPWFKAFLASDPEKLALRLRLPFVAYFAEKDVQVPSASNAEHAAAVAAAVRTAGFPAVVKTWPGLNHLYQKAGTGLPQEYGSLEGDFSEDVAAELAGKLLSFLP